MNQPKALSKNAHQTRSYLLIACACAISYILTFLALYRAGLNNAISAIISAVLIAACLLCFMLGSLFYKKLHLARFSPRQVGKLYHSIFSEANDIIVLIDTVDFNVIEANTAFHQLLGYTLEETLSLDLYGLLAEDREEVEWTVQRVFEEKRCYLGEQKLRLKNEKTLAVELNATIINSGDREVVCMFAKDVSERKHYEGELFYKANHDPLTGLPNRTLLLDRLNQAVFKHERMNKMIAVMFCDLDQFKVINDTYGHAVGDTLLKKVSGRLQGFIRKSDTIARLGGDEFTIVIENISWPRDAIHVAQKIIDAMEKPFSSDVGDLFITTSIGMTCYPLDGNTAADLLQNADSAMYYAKEQGRNNYQFFSQELNDRMRTRLMLESGLRQALEKHEFLLHYQPRIHVPTGAVLGVEALVRWQHPDKGLVLPLDFIPLAEETGLIVQIGEWVLRTACAQNKAWHEAGYPHFKISVNVSVRQFCNQWLVATVQKILHETGLKPEFLELEITESLLMQNPDETVMLLSDLKKMGVSISLDDFGTGYSSLMQLKELPIDLLKIDKKFIGDINRHSNDETLVATILQMAHNLNVGVVGEGVETREQVNYLVNRGCYEQQGHYFSKARPAKEISAYIDEKTKATSEDNSN